MHLISITKVALQVMRKGPTSDMQISAHLQRDQVLYVKTIIASSILLKAFGVHF